MPARNAGATIGSALESILSQDYEGPLQVVVAEGESHDETQQVLDDWRTRDGRILVVDNPGGSTPGGLNRAIAAANGDVIVRCDAHSQLPPHYVSTAVRLLDENAAANVGGAQVAVGESPFERAVAMAMSSPLGAGDARYRLGGAPGPTDTVYLGVFPRAVLDRTGGFDETLERNQDYELNIRIRESGGVVYFHPDLAVRYRPRGSFAALWRQYFEYGQWKRVVIGRHPGSIRWRQLAAPALVVGLALSLPLALTPARPLALVIPVLYLTFILIGSIWLSLRRRDPAALLLPAVLLVMHLAWGLGFLRGLGRRDNDRPH